MSLRVSFLAVTALASSIAGAQEHDHSQHQESSSAAAPAEHDHAHQHLEPAQDQSAHDHSEHSQQGQPTQTSPHVAPDPPQQVLPPMSHHEMDTLMEMSDSQAMWAVLADELEFQSGDDPALAWNVHGWYGGDTNKLLIESEGERVEDEDVESRIDVLWDRAWLRWWNLRAGLRQDLGEVDRSWAGVGVVGLAPHFIEVEAMLYVSDEGQSAVRLEFSRELLFSQQWVLEPKLELQAFAEDDARAGYNSGLSELELGLRLRYEVRREFAPYVGAVYEKHFGENDDSDLKLAAGLRFWF